MSKKCKNCGAVLPDEANYCLECMTAFDNSIKESKDAPIPNGTFKERLLSRLKGLKSRVSSMSKRQKTALFSALAMLFLLVPLCVYLFSPVDPVGGVTADTAAGNGNNGNRPITRVEALFDEVFGTESNPKNDPLSENGSTPVSGSGSGNNSVSETVGSGAAAGNTEAAAPGNGNSTSTGSGSSSGSGSNGNNSLGSSEPVLNYDDWEYEMDDDDLIVTKYTGNDKNIMVPDKIDGKNVSRICKGVFKDNHQIETVTFKDSEDYHGLWIENASFENCSSLKKIRFPGNTDLGIYEEYALNCLNLSQLEINFSQYRYIEGALYYYNGSKWSLRAYCEGYTASTYTVPAWCTSISAASRNLSNNRYLKTINIHANCYAMNKQWNYYEYKYLENINVDSNSPYYYSENGILYSKKNGELTLMVYPAGKTDNTFNVAENCTINCYGMKDGLFANIETIALPTSSKIAQGTVEDIKEYFPNLKIIKMKKGHPNYENIKNTLDKIVNVVEY